MLNSKLIAAILVCAFSFLIFNDADAHYGEKLSGYGTATIDGIRSIGEWDGAHVISVFGDKSEGSLLLVMNDEENLYLGLYVLDNLLTPDDQFTIRFDNSHNGIIDVNDDSGGFSGLDSLRDGYFSGTEWISDIQGNGLGAGSNEGAKNFMEYSKPLSSGDKNDFNLSLGDTVGFCVSYVRDGISTDSTQYGPACRSLGNDQKLYGDIVIIPYTVIWRGLIAMDADKRNVDFGERIGYQGYLYGDRPIEDQFVQITVKEQKGGKIILQQEIIPESQTVDYFENTAWPFTFSIDTSQNKFNDGTSYVVEAKYVEKSSKLNFLIRDDTKPNMIEEDSDTGESIGNAGDETGELVVEAGKEAGKTVVDVGENTGETGQEVLEQTSEELQENGGGCLIATATYGTELAPQVQKLRELRDDKLLHTETGTAFMKSFNEFYYTFSPRIADLERENPAFREGVKLAITPMISSLSILNHVDMNSEIDVLGYGVGLILLNVGMYVGVPAVIVIGIKKQF